MSPTVTHCYQLLNAPRQVRLNDGSSAILKNSRLRAEAPQLLLDFYEGRLKWDK